MVGEPEGQSQETKEGKRPPPTPMIIRVFRALKRYENRRRRRHKKEASNTEVTMARWNRWGTLALVVVGLVTAVIFWRQLNAMRGQLNEMKLARADTARATRPYLMFEPVAMTFNPTAEQMGVPGPVPPARQFLALFKFTNYGATPAIIYDEKHSVEFPNITPYSFRDMLDTLYAQGYVIGAQHRTKDIRSWQRFGEDTWVKFNGLGGQLYFSAIVTYEDVFGSQYSTHVCFLVDVPFGTLTPREIGPNCTNKRT